MCLQNVADVAEDTACRTVSGNARILTFGVWPALKHTRTLRELVARLLHDPRSTVNIQLYIYKQSSISCALLSSQILFSLSMIELKLIIDMKRYVTSQKSTAVLSLATMLLIKGKSHFDRIDDGEVPHPFSLSSPSPAPRIRTARAFNQVQELLEVTTAVLLLLAFLC